MNKKDINPEHLISLGKEWGMNLEETVPGTANIIRERFKRANFLLTAIKTSVRPKEDKVLLAQFRRLIKMLDTNIWSLRITLMVLAHGVELRETTDMILDQEYDLRIACNKYLLSLERYKKGARLKQQ